MSCAHKSPESISTSSRQEHKSPEFEQISDRVWVARSFRYLEKWGFFPANGLIIKTDAGSLLIDPGYNDADAVKIIDWANQHVGPVHAVLVTHFHDDRTGGLGEVQRREIPSFAYHQTLELCKKAQSPGPQHALSSPFGLRRFGVDGELFFPGPAHTLDNTIVWLDEEKLLFGGCLVKAKASQSLGNIADASVSDWPAAIKRISARYQDIHVVVPGHGLPGGPELLVRTSELVHLALKNP